MAAMKRRAVSKRFKMALRSRLLALRISRGGVMVYIHLTFFKAQAKIEACATSLARNVCLMDEIPLRRAEG